MTTKADPVANLSESGGNGGGHESLTRRVYTRLRDDILSGDLPPDKKLKIDELRRDYAIGSSPLREALSLLTSDGLVERLDQRGFRVSAASAGEFDELLKTRCWLEDRALRESIAHGDTQWEEAVVLAFYRLSRVPRSSDADHFVANKDWEQLHKRFHMALISACGASLLLRFCDQLYDQSIRYRQLTGPAAYPKRDTQKEHEEIMQATLDRNADLAAERLISHYRQTGSILSKVLTG